MSTKKTIAMVKTLNKKVLREIKRKKPDFKSVYSLLEAEKITIKKLSNKARGKATKKAKAKKSKTKKSAKALAKKVEADVLKK